MRAPFTQPEELVNSKYWRKHCGTARAAVTLGRACDPAIVPRALAASQELQYELFTLSEGE
jgi:hypothetical protein